MAATDDLIARDAVIRQAAFNQVRSLQTGDPILSHEAIRQGFVFEGQRWPLINPQRGIFKPRGMPFVLSIRTVVARKGARVWYDDQRRVHRQIFPGDVELDYAFMRCMPSTTRGGSTTASLSTMRAWTPIRPSHFFSRLRRAEIGQRHCISRHLHAYSAEMAWREDNRRKPNGTLYLNAAGAALGHPVSRVWAGYWQRSV